MTTTAPPLTLAIILRRAWKQLALADQTDADEVLKVLKDTLEALEQIEGEALAQQPNP